MGKVKLIKKFKAYFIRLKIHKITGFASNLLIYAGYLSKASKWIERNKSTLQYNDFYNKKVVHRERIKLYEFLINHKKLENKNINYLEFGVGRGNSMTWWTQNNHNSDSRFWGFDTFEGLPEKYGDYETGTFSLEGNFPDIKDDRISFIKGLFQDTLLNTIPDIDFKGTTVIHMDSDLYTSTIFTLGILYPYIKPGDIIMFDEFIVPYHEFKAFDDFVRSFYIKLKPLGAINNYLQIAFEVLQTPAHPDINSNSNQKN